MIKVLITEDSPTMVEIMKRVLESDSEIQVIGWAKNGRESIKMTEALKPDVITMDIQMPIMDGFEATKHIMENTPTSILIVSSLINEDVNVSFNALKMGALDVLQKPKITRGATLEKMGEELIQRIKTVARVLPLKRREINVNFRRRESNKMIFKSMDGNRILAIGASTGGPAALSFIVKEIPARFPYPVLITQHITKGFIGGLISWLKKGCSLEVKVGENNEEIRKGTIYVAPDHFHMGVTKNHRLLLSNALSIMGHRPSVDFLMESVASVYADNSMGVLLTGMGTDGAKGMMAIRKRGGHTVSQDEKTSVIFGMPGAAIKEGAVKKVCPLEEIGGEILQWGMGRRRDDR